MITLVYCKYNELLFISIMKSEKESCIIKKPFTTKVVNGPFSVYIVLLLLESNQNLILSRLRRALHLQ